MTVRLIFLHAMACGYKCNWSLLRCLHQHGHGQSRIGVDNAQKIMFIAANAKLERRDLLNEEERDLKLFANGEGSDHVLNEAYVDAAPSL